MRLICLFSSLLAILWLTPTETVEAFSPLPPFNMNRNTGEATHIVIGTLQPDGTLKVTRVIKGSLPDTSSLKIPYAEHLFIELQAVLKNDPPRDVVAFLVENPKDKSYELVAHGGSVVALTSTDKVCAWFEEAMMYACDYKVHESLTRDQFLSDLDHSLKISDDLTALLGIPRSPERVEKLLGFLCGNIKWPESESEDRSFWTLGDYYFFNKVTAGIYDPSPEEEAVAERSLKSATTDAETAMTLAVIGRINCSKSIYQSILPYVDRTKPGQIRKQGFRALTSVDSYTGSEVLSRFLKMDDPQVWEVTLALPGERHGRRADILNPAVVGPTLELARATLDWSRKPENIHESNQGYRALALLGNYYHPSFLPIMMEWADDKIIPSRAQASSNLRSTLGRGNELFDPSKIKEWWEKSREVLQRNYDLASPEGRSQWLESWNKTADSITRKMLMRLWDFQLEIPESALLEDCNEKDGEAAKALLSELWQRNRLCTETRKLLVRTYLRMKIVDEQPTWRGVSISGNRNFPFPKAAWINMNCDLAVGREPVLQAGEVCSSSSLVGSGPRNFNNVGRVGDGAGKALVEIWEMNYEHSPPVEQWRLRWELDQKNTNADSGKAIERP
ncbi:MAG: hypothetical protein V4819_23610 [Verrucomicrobiota bacterium]